jgi:hypothetical protein
MTNALGGHKSAQEVTEHRGLRNTAGVHHVASSLFYEGFRATVAQRPGTTGADVLAGLSGAPSTAALSVRTTVCPPGFGGGEDS